MSLVRTGARAKARPRPSWGELLFALRACPLWSQRSLRRSLADPRTVFPARPCASMTITALMMIFCRVVRYGVSMCAVKESGTTPKLLLVFCPEFFEPRPTEGANQFDYYPLSACRLITFPAVSPPMYRSPTCCAVFVVA